MTAAVSRQVAQSLAGYLCGTHSGLLGRRRGDRLAPAATAALHAEVPRHARRLESPMGQHPWEPAPAADALRRRLSAALRHPGVIELILFGSHARGTTTGFSDVDAVLVIPDDTAEDPARLRSLRAAVLQAQRAVIAFQPMQHHGFEVVTPTLLRDAAGALDMPAEAFAETRSLFGRPVGALFGGEPATAPKQTLRHLVATVASASRWPSHPWHLHRLISMFELLPAVFLQSCGKNTTKAASFDEGRRLFGERWWPYDALADVRELWPEQRRPTLHAAMTCSRNPWVAVAAWTRLPARAPRDASRRLSRECLVGLQELAGSMLAQSRLTHGEPATGFVARLRRDPLE